MSKVIFLIFLIISCGGKKPESSGEEKRANTAAFTITENERVEAIEIFKLRCAICHGITGKADGPTSKSLSPVPRDFTLKEWQDSVTDEHIADIIKYGGSAVDKSPTMPGNPDLIAKEGIIYGLVEHIRKLGGK